jgi:hypothetical protein
MRNLEKLVKNISGFWFLVFSASILKKPFYANRVWTVDRGVAGETCTDYKDDDSELWCQYVRIPDCVDRTVRCTEPPTPAKALKTITQYSQTGEIDELGTSIDYTCPDRLHYFDYPVAEPFISFYYTNNINDINVTCNDDGYT